MQVATSATHKNMSTSTPAPTMPPIAAGVQTVSSSTETAVSTMTLVVDAVNDANVLPAVISIVLDMVDNDVDDNVNASPLLLGALID
jgi:hypothetical protein